MRFFSLFILMLLCFSDAYALEMDSSFKRIILNSAHMEIYVDSSGSETAKSLISKPGLFTPAEKNFFPYSNNTVWTKFRLKNISDESHSYQLMNDFAAMDEVDIFVVSGQTVEASYFFGDTRKVSEVNMIKRFPNIQLSLGAGDQADILVRYHSTTPVNIRMMLFSRSAFSGFISGDMTVWGLLIGVTLALAVYNLMMFLSLRDKAFMFYVLHALVSLYNALTTSGHVYAYLSGVFSLNFLNLTYKITPSLGMILMFLFINSFFDLKRNMRRLYIVNNTAIAVFALLLASLFYLYPADKLMVHNQLSALMLQGGLLLMIISALTVRIRKLFGSTYFLLGAGTFFASLHLYILHYLGVLDLGTWIIYAMPFGMAIDVTLFSIALGYRIKLIENERMKNLLMLEEMNKFNSTSHLLAGVLHQFKQPLVYLGSEILNLRTELFKKGRNEEKENRIAENMDKHVQNMSGLVSNFYSFYSKDSEIKEISLEETVSKTLEIMDSPIKSGQIKITLNNLGKTVKTDEKSLSQALLIILENAVSILNERSAGSPEIRIYCEDSPRIQLCIEDNAGGIRNEDMKFIFKMHYSKRKGKGLGIGLALAKNIVENRLKGKLSAENTTNGALFRISL